MLKNIKESRLIRDDILHNYRYFGILTRYSLAELSNSSTNSNPKEVDSYFRGLKNQYKSEPLDQLSGLFRFRVVNHILFWASIVFVFAHLGSLFGGSFKNNFINMLVLIPVQMIAAYILVYFQIPKLLLQGKWFQFIAFLAIVAYLTSILARISVIYIAEPLIGREGINESLWEIVADPIYLLQVYTIVLYIPAVILFLIKMASEKFKQENQVQLLQTEKWNMELNFLKAQMNPHFLFNTLNNLYALAKAGAAETPDMIMKLSELLDYTIYDCQEERVAIGKEWELIENYADLQAMRFSEPLNIVLDPHIEDEEVRVAPLILITLVENAFKYALQTSEPRVNIKLVSDQENLHLHILNSRNPSSEILSKDKSRKKIGVRNVSSQLELLYPLRHELSINERANEHEVNLKLHL